MNKQELVLSSMGHTWFFDIDGTIFKHNGYKIDGHDTLLPGVKAYFDSIPEKDFIILITSRTDEVAQSTVRALKENCIRFDRIIFNAPFGERILINDNKPSGLIMSYAVSLDRDKGLSNASVIVDEGL